jgi:hypothetical protein
MAREMGKRGRRRINDEFSADTMVKSIGRVYRELLDQKGINGEA